MADSPKHDGKFWFGFFLGGLIGAITLFFLGTKEGQKAGKKIKDHSDDLLDEITSRLEILKDKGRELEAQGKELKEAVAGSVTEGKDKAAKDLVAKLDQTLAHIEEIQERGRKTTAGIRKGLFRNTPKK